MEMLIFTSEDTTIFSKDITVPMELCTNAMKDLHQHGHAWPLWEDVKKDDPLKFSTLTIETMIYTMIAKILLDSELNHLLFIQELKR